MSVETLFLIIIWITIILGLGTMIYLIIREEKKSKIQHQTRMIEIMKSDMDIRHKMVQRIREMSVADNNFDWRTGMYKDKKIVEVDPRVEKYNFYKSLGFAEEKIIELIDEEFNKKL